MVILSHAYLLSHNLAEAGKCNEEYSVANRQLVISDSQKSSERHGLFIPSQLNSSCIISGMYYADGSKIRYQLLHGLILLSQNSYHYRGNLEIYL